MYMSLQRAWPEIKDKLDCNNLTKFDWSKLRVGSSIYNIAKMALQYGERALKIGVFARGDYIKLCELMVFHLGGEVTNFHLHQPGACHEARFKADAQYLLLLQMTSKITDIMNHEDRSMVETA